MKVLVLGHTAASRGQMLLPSCTPPWYCSYFSGSVSLLEVFVFYLLIIWAVPLCQALSWKYRDE